MARLAVSVANCTLTAGLNPPLGIFIRRVSASVVPTPSSLSHIPALPRLAQLTGPTLLFPATSREQAVFPPPPPPSPAAPPALTESPPQPPPRSDGANPSLPPQPPPLFRIRPTPPRLPFPC